MNNQFLTYAFKTFQLIAIATICIFFIRSFIVEPGRVNGRSMENTFIDENIFFVNKFILLFHQPKRGNIVQFIDPQKNTLTIKRIIGLPGEQVVIRSNHVYIITKDGNEILLDEPYLKQGMITQSASGIAMVSNIIPPNEYFVLGDNRTHSFDSRHYNTIHRSYIQGLVIKLNNR
ncbi:MAG TPA: signal peptidase I [Patescibacteria group bacterium]|nr:signal peptidase I [Patescibacteria group bacterium]